MAAFLLPELCNELKEALPGWSFRTRGYSAKVIRVSVGVPIASISTIARADAFTVLEFVECADGDHHSREVGWVALEDPQMFEKLVAILRGVLVRGLLGPGHPTRG